MALDKIQIQCVICKKPFAPKKVDSIYCSKNCSDAAYCNKKAQQKQEEQRKIVADKISDNRIYIFPNRSNNSLLNRKKNTLSSNSSRTYPCKQSSVKFILM